MVLVGQVFLRNLIVRAYSRLLITFKKNPQYLKLTKTYLMIVTLTSLGKSKIVNHSNVKCQQEIKINGYSAKTM